MLMIWNLFRLTRLVLRQATTPRSDIPGLGPCGVGL
jgi:hypothetical protein